MTPEQRNRLAKAHKIAAVLQSFNVDSLDLVFLDDRTWSLATQAAGFKSLSTATREMVVAIIEEREASESGDLYGAWS